ncbi:hypothetical protein [Metabacillus litoralis]|uniref:hypothetical protein n=1 Tax=Metabacillus litoralis TaxID=152268 RepID=UPI00203F22F7|nr:hypothetical protein [Metabacillus litoralis]MCM3411879.1 hypothetical protein [Metabacillus litoralis]
MAKRQVHIWLDDEDFIEFEIEGKNLLDIDNGGSKMIKVELKKQARIKREKRLAGINSNDIETRQLNAWEQLQRDLGEM